MPIGRNICKCPQPPGSEANCGEHQLAICRVRGGVAYPECLDPPPDVIQAGRDRLKIWVLEQITQQPRSPFMPITPAEETILQSGVIPGIDGDTTFSINLNMAAPTPGAAGAAGSSSAL
jgi:hypothetical protein